AVDRNAVGLKFIDHILDRKQMIGQALRFGIKANHLELAVRFHLREVHAPAARIAEKLPAAFLISKKKRLLAVRHPSGEKIRHQQRLAGARGAAHKRDAVAKKTPAAHLVDLSVAAGDANRAGMLLQPQ